MESFITHSEKNNYLKYGGLDKKYDKLIISADPVMISLDKKALTDLKKLYPPKDTESLKEIEYLKKRINSRNSSEIDFAQESEKNEVKVYKNFFVELGLNVSLDNLNRIFKTTDSILFYFKKYFDRARPKQLANKYKVEYEIPISHTANHPSYPSGHYYDSLIISHIFSELNPRKKTEIQKFCRRIGETRLDVGLHYPTDNDFANKLAKEVIKTPPVQNLIEDFS